MGFKKFTTFTLWVIAAACILNVQALLGAGWVDYELVKFENANGTLFTTDFKGKRINRTTFTISGPAEIVTDFSNDWDIEVFILHSAMGNNQFVRLPFKLPKDDLCKTIDGMYITGGVAKGISDTSDLPAPTEGQPLCPQYKKGMYTIRQYYLNRDIIPKFLQPGYYKIENLFTKKNSDEMTVFVSHIKLT